MKYRKRPKNEHREKNEEHIFFESAYTYNIEMELLFNSIKQEINLTPWKIGQLMTN